MPIQRRGMRALQIWCARVTESYDNVNVVDLTSSFRDGLAFCAIIHHFRPELLEYGSLEAKNILENNAMAFKVAEESLDIPSLLDPQDMLECELPDKFSVVTYLSQFYHTFKDADGSRASPSPDISLNCSGLTRCRGSESSEENDSLLQSASSSESTPLGTPTTSRPAHRIFNQAELIAKYGEDIFSTSDTPKKSSGFSGSGKDRENSRGKGIVASVCQDFARKAAISEEKES